MYLLFPRGNSSIFVMAILETQYLYIVLYFKFIILRSLYDFLYLGMLNNLYCNIVFEK